MIEVFERIRRPLARLVEAYLLRLNAASILSAYVGHNSGDQILQGRVHRGDGEEIDAAILFADVIGFTALSNTRTGPEIVALLNDAFDIMVPPVEAHGGEILKFLGDGFFAIFPYGDNVTLAGAVRAASEAVVEGEQKLAEAEVSKLVAFPLGDPCRTLPLRQYRRRQPARLHGDRPAGELYRAAARRRIRPVRDAGRFGGDSRVSLPAGTAHRRDGFQGF